ncbi:Actin-binding protein IPP [Armadillidium vulgare]|nr:Actin-binding protein IPP [Armadillidium vulgare]
MDDQNVQIVVKDKTFNIPKEILSSSSDYFKVMFSSNFRESSQKSVDIQDIDPLAFQLVVDYVQFKSRKITETLENLVYALQCASLLQFCEVQKFCEEQIIPEINFQNCLVIHKVVSQISCGRLADAAMTCATWNCKTIFRLNSFLEESLEDVCNFLRRPELNIHNKNEWEVWKSIYRWIKKDEEERKPFLLKLLTCIDYSNLKLGDITDMTYYDVVMDDINATEFLNIINPNISVDVNSLSCNDEVKTAFKRVSSKTEGCETDLSWCSMLLNITGYCFYILGGQYQIGSNKWNSDVWSFDTVTQKWEIHEALPENRRNHMMCVVDSVIYLLGGYGKHRISLTSMDAYDTINRKWLKSLPKVPFNGCGACCAYNQTILVFVEDMLHTYNVENRKWFSEKIRSTEARSYVSAVCHNDLVYLLRSYSNEVYITKPSEKIKIEYFGSFQNNTENLCIVNDALFSFSVDDNLKNKPIKETVNIIEVIPLSQESYLKYEEYLSNEKDLDKGNEAKDDNIMEVEEASEYLKIERSKLNVEANHSQHNREELNEDYSRRKKEYKYFLRTGNDEYVSDSDDQLIQQQQNMQMPQGAHMIHPYQRQRTRSQQEMLMQLSSNQGQQSDELSPFHPYPKVFQGPKKGIKIWDSKRADLELSNIPFMTGSSCHGCSTVFKLTGT